MILKIENKDELKKAKELVKLLDTEVIDKLEIGEFILNNNTITKLEKGNEIFAPSELLKEVLDMSDLILRDITANNKVIKEKDFSLALPEKEADLVLAYKDIFNCKFSVWYPEVLDRIYWKNQRRKN